MNKKLILIFAIANLALVVACGSSVDRGPAISTFTLNGESVTLASAEYMVKSDKIYFSGKALEKHFSLTLKDLVPGRQIGVCRDDLCIPFDVGEKFPNAAIKQDGDYFIPVVRLMYNLGEDVDWDKEKLSLDVTIAERRDFDLELNNFKKKEDK